jgi:hypothetical protein
MPKDHQLIQLEDQVNLNQVDLKQILSVPRNLLVRVVHQTLNFQQQIGSTQKDTKLLQALILEMQMMVLINDDTGKNESRFRND